MAMERMPKVTRTSGPGKKKRPTPKQAGPYMPKVTGKDKKIKFSKGKAMRGNQVGPYMPKVKGKAKKVKGRAMRGTMGPVRSM